MEPAPIEEPLEDLAEQSMPVDDDNDEETVDTGSGEVPLTTGSGAPGGPVHASWDADEGDTVEQSREEPLDEDDWR